MANEHIKELNAVKEILNAYSTRVHYSVTKTYFDYGQNWLWTTLLADDGKNSWQAITPAEQKLILFGDIDDANLVIRRLIKFFETN